MPEKPGNILFSNGKSIQFVSSGFMIAKLYKTGTLCSMITGFVNA